MNGKRLEWSTQRKCKRANWEGKTCRMTGLRNGAKETNGWLDILNSRAFDARQQLYAGGKAFSNLHVRKLMQGEDLEPVKTIAEVWKYHTENIGSLIGKGYSKSTLKKYATCWNALTRYMKLRYRLTDIRLDQLDYKFIKEYEMWLKTDYGVINNTAIGMVRKVRVIIRLAMDYGWLKRDPFLPLRMKLDEVHRDYLTNAELSKLAVKRFSPKKLNMVRDMFLFSCYTGLAFSDTLALKQEDIINGEDGEPWLQTHRIKNNNRVRVPLLSPALKIIEFYKDHPRIDRGYLLPKISNQKANAYLKEITEKLDLHKRLTYHCARHTFATTVTLTNGVPIETVGQMLGHKNIRSTQHYARVTDTKVQVDMKPIKIRYEQQELKLSEDFFDE